MRPGDPVHIIGAEVLCAAGKSLHACMDSMREGRGTPGSPPHFKSEQAVEYPVFAVEDADLTVNNPKLTRTANLMLSATHNAIQAASFDTEILSKLRVGVCIGTSVGASLNFLDFYRNWKQGKTPELKPINTYLSSNPAEVIAKHFSLSGPCQTVVNACTSGADAIGIAASWVRHGLCDIVIAGGADELSKISYNGFARLMITSPEPCRPFDKNRKGLNLGEGAGVMLLASANAIQTLETKVHGKIAGYGTCGDAHHLTAPHPKARGLLKAMDDAFDQAAIKRSEIAFVNVHGTGTPTNDPVEGQVLSEQFSSAFISATKGYTGHTLGAAGAIEAAFSLACLEQQELPPSNRFQTFDPEIGCSPVSEPTSFEGSYALSQSLAFGGNNSILIIQGGDTCS